MQLNTLNVMVREEHGKGAARRVRRMDKIPGIVYGKKAEPISIAIDRRELEHVMHAHAGEHAVVELSCADNDAVNGPVLLKDVQHHPVRDHILHVDFQRISLDEKIQTSVPLKIVGHCKGVVEGGVLDHQMREVDVECLALNVPEFIEVDVTDLGLGESLHVNALKAPEGVTIVTDPEYTVVAIHVPRVLAEKGQAEEELAEGDTEGAGEGETESDASES